MMKNILIVLTVLAMASVANAALLISVNGVVDPPDTSIEIKPSDVVVIDVHSDGTTMFGGFFLHVGGLGSYDISQAINNYNPDPPFPVEATIIDMHLLGMPNTIFMDLAKPILPEPLPVGVMVDQILVHCDGQPGDVTLTLTTEQGVLMDVQVIHQIPEPITFALLGLGGLFLRRRK